LLFEGGMARTALDFDWVTPLLAVGARFAAPDAARLAHEHAIRHVVDLRLEACDDARVLGRHGIELLHLPTEDVCAIDDDRIEQGVGWVNERLDRGSRVLIHCHHGIGRSALLALCVLVSRGEEPLDALARAKDARRVVSPSPDQLAAFTRYCALHRERTGAAWEVPSFDALASIAYRHLVEAQGR
jgi:protein-tyrosine phosphatase